MKNFALLISADIAKLITQRFALYLPMSWLGTSSISELSKGVLWLFIDNGSEKYIYAQFRVNEVLIEKAGKSEGLVIIGDQASSEYYYNQAEMLGIQSPNIDHSPSSIVFQLETQQVKELKELIESSKKIVYKVPAAVIKKYLNYVPAKEEISRKLARLESHFRKSMLYQEVPGTHTHPKDWSPYLSLAVAVLESSDEVDEENVKSIAEYIHGSQSIGFDFDFNAIDENDLHTRNFSAPQSMVDSREVLEKMRSAEFKHQQILGELAYISKKSGVSPQQSNSIDLLLEGLNEMVICEVKSSSDLNLSSQCRKGLSQLIEYRYFLSKVTSKKTSLVLVIEDSESSMILDEYEKIFASVNARLLRYKKELEWPNRCFGFHEIVGNLRNK